MLTIPCEKNVFAFSASNPPVAYASSGDRIRFETKDCFGGQIQSETQHMGAIDWSNINPATGPLFVEGAHPGDVLKVEILSIELDDHAAICDAPGEGVIGAVLRDERTRILPVERGKLRFNSRLSIPVAPMIGVIGTAPARGSVPTGTPGTHGGNMDCTRIGAGTALYLPVQVEGALLAMGDLHAVMGDGEVVVCGAEIAGAVTVQVSVLHTCSYPLPFLVCGDSFMTICSSDTLDQAATDATLAMQRFLCVELGMDVHEAGMLLSLMGDVRVCQMVDPQKTCRMEVSYSLASQYGYHFQ